MKQVLITGTSSTAALTLQCPLCRAGHDNGDVRLWDMGSGSSRLLKQHTNTVTAVLVVLMKRNEELLITSALAASSLWNVYLADVLHSARSWNMEGHGMNVVAEEADCLFLAMCQVFIREWVQGSTTCWWMQPTSLLNPAPPAGSLPIPDCHSTVASQCLPCALALTH